MWFTSVFWFCGQMIESSTCCGHFVLPILDIMDQGNPLVEWISGEVCSLFLEEGKNRVSSSQNCPLGFLCHIWPLKEDPGSAATLWDERVKSRESSEHLPEQGTPGQVCLILVDDFLLKDGVGWMEGSFLCIWSTLSTRPWIPMPRWAVAPPSSGIWSAKRFLHDLLGLTSEGAGCTPYGNTLYYLGNSHKYYFKAVSPHM